MTPELHYFFNTHSMPYLGVVLDHDRGVWAKGTPQALAHIARLHRLAQQRGQRRTQLVDRQRPASDRPETVK